MDPSGIEWRLIPEESREGPINMALDEIAADTVSAGGPATLRIYRWDPSTLSLGLHQPRETVDWEYCRREGVAVTRRPTGGGGIYHDAHGDISYSIIAPADEVPGDLLESYHQLLEPVFSALERLGIDATLADEERPALYPPACYLRGLNPAHDVVVAGRKLSGNAQHRTRDAVVQHGSITFTRCTEPHLAVFDDPGVSVREFEARVTSIREHLAVARSTVTDTLETAFVEWADATEGAWSSRELDAARRLAEEKFGRDSWTHRQ